MGDSKRLIINTAWCKGCGICVEFCPKHALKVENEKVKFADEGACIKCGLCELRCPDYAIYIESEDK